MKLRNGSLPPKLWFETFFVRHAERSLIFALEAVRREFWLDIDLLDILGFDFPKFLDANLQEVAELVLEHISAKPFPHFVFLRELTAKNFPWSRLLGPRESEEDGGGCLAAIRTSKYKDDILILIKFKIDEDSDGNLVFGLQEPEKQEKQRHFSLDNAKDSGKQPLKWIRLTAEQRRSHPTRDDDDRDDLQIFVSAHTESDEEVEEGKGARKGGSSAGAGHISTVELYKRKALGVRGEGRRKGGGKVGKKGRGKAGLERGSRLAMIACEISARTSPCSSSGSSSSSSSSSFLSDGHQHRCPLEIIMKSNN